MIESKLVKVIIFITANENVINEKNSVEGIAIILDKLLCQQNEKDLIDLLKTFKLYKTDMNYRSKRILRKVFKKFYVEFIDDQELSDDMKKERLLDICNKLKPPSNDQASPHTMIENIKFQLTILTGKSRVLLNSV